MPASPYDPSTWNRARVAYQPIAGLLLSPQDLDLLAWPWWLDNFGYARRSVRVGRSRPRVFMHRLILIRIAGRPLSAQEFCDHINHNRLDNRRENLRVVTAQANSENRGIDRRNSLGLRGVSFHAKSGRWEAHVCHRGTKQYLGLFTTPEEAAAVAARRRSELGFADSQAPSMECSNGNAAA